MSSLQQSGVCACGVFVKERDTTMVMVKEEVKLLPHSSANQQTAHIQESSVTHTDTHTVCCGINGWFHVTMLVVVTSQKNYLSVCV